MQIANAIDLHCHYGPETIGGTLDAASGRGVTALEASREAAANGVAALVLKSNIKGAGQKVVDDEGWSRSEVRELFGPIRQKEAILATGHESAEEHYSVVRELASGGNVLVIYAGEERAGPRLTPSQCRELADLGATIELTALTCHDLFGVKGKSTTEMASMIGGVGPARCTLSTDYGWSTVVPRPAAGLRAFLEALWAGGVAERDLETMVSANPAQLPGIEA